MGRSVQQLSLAWLLAAVCLSSPLLLGGVRAAASSSQDRSSAFIGYTEAQGQIPTGYGRCLNQLDNCEQAAAMNGCLTDPFRLRRLCPISCLVEPCVNQGTVLVSADHVAVVLAAVACVRRGGTSAEANCVLARACCWLVVGCAKQTA